jgi:hypothetical protein
MSVPKRKKKAKMPFANLIKKELQDQEEELIGFNEST